MFANYLSSGFHYLTLWPLSAMLFVGSLKGL